MWTPFRRRDVKRRSGTHWVRQGNAWLEIQCSSDFVCCLKLYWSTPHLYAPIPITNHSDTSVTVWHELYGVYYFGTLIHSSLWGYPWAERAVNQSIGQSIRRKQTHFARANQPPWLYVCLYAVRQGTLIKMMHPSVHPLDGMHSVRLLRHLLPSAYFPSRLSWGSCTPRVRLCIRAMIRSGSLALCTSPQSIDDVVYDVWRYFAACRCGTFV